MFLIQKFEKRLRNNVHPAFCTSNANTKLAALIGKSVASPLPRNDDGLVTGRCKYTDAFETTDPTALSVVNANSPSVAVHGSVVVRVSSPEK